MITPPKKVMRPNKVAASSDDSLDLCDCGDGDDDDIDGGGLLTILSLLLLFLYFFSVLFVNIHTPNFFLSLKCHLVYYSSSSFDSLRSSL
jgi:hypothetical protein